MIAGNIWGELPENVDQMSGIYICLHHVVWQVGKSMSIQCSITDKVDGIERHLSVQPHAHLPATPH